MGHRKRQVPPLANQIPRILLLGAILLCSALLRMHAQDAAEADSSATASSERWRIGLYGALLRNIHTARFRALPGVPSCCPEYDGGAGIGVAVDVSYERPFAPHWSAGISVGYAFYDARFSAEESIVADDGAGPVDAIIEHGIDIDFPTLGIEPVLVWRPLDRFGVFAGGRLDFAVGAAYRQEERLLSPDNLLFPNGDVTRLEFDGDLPDAASVLGSLLIGVRYDFIDTARPWFIIPHIAFRYGLTPILEDLDWKAHSIRFGLSLHWLKREEADPETEEDTPLRIEVDPAEAGGT